MQTKRALIWGLGLLVGSALWVDSSAQENQTQPQQLTIQELSYWFGGVRFSHSDHSTIAGDCITCHHHSEGEAARCSDCHAAAVDLSSPELVPLKIAYHERCMGCHRESEAGPLACEDCHRRRALPLGAPLPSEK
jgi:hypothetical protein